MVTFHQAHYLTSAAVLDKLPPDQGREIAFIGRSNAGKSSALNALTASKNLARVSKTPGRTQLINFFALDHGHRLVDLPGYGYAKVAQSIKRRWEDSVNAYLETRRCLVGLVVVMDVRHPLQRTDQILIDWAVQCQVPLHLLLTKMDKLSKQAAQKSLDYVEKQLTSQTHAATPISVQLFSASKHMGLPTLQEKLTNWFSQ